MTVKSAPQLTALFKILHSHAKYTERLANAKESYLFSKSMSMHMLLKHSYMNEVHFL